MVEHHEIDVDRIEDQLNRDQDSQQITASNESVDTRKEHHSADNQVKTVLVS